MLAELFVGAERRHAVVAFAEEAFVFGIADERRQPFARAVAGEVRGIRTGVLAVELMTLRAVHGVAREEFFSFVDHGGVACVRIALGDQVIDASVRGKLNAMAVSLKN